MVIRKGITTMEKVTGMTGHNADDFHGSWLLKRFLILMVAIPMHQTRLAAQFHIRLQNDAGETKIFAQESGGRIYVEVIPVAVGLGADVMWNHPHIAMKLSSFTATLNTVKSTYNFNEPAHKKKKAKPKVYSLADRVLTVDQVPMVSLQSLKPLFKKSFVYDLQRKLLTVKEQNTKSDDFREIPVRSVFSGQKVWVSLEDLARHLRVVIYSSQAKRYSLVLPDFAIIELRVGQSQVYKRQEVYRLMEDPLLVFSGAPYISLNSVQPVFGLEASWNRASQKLVVPLEYGRLKEEEKDSEINFVGYKPQPLRFQLEKFTAYYQHPVPTYGSDHDQIYDSVKDFMTNDPIRPPAEGFDQVSGESLINLSGSLLRIPVQGRALVEKVGNQSALVNGAAVWGFPLFQVKVGREYVTLAGLANQFDLLDHVAISHSNNHYGNQNVNPEVQVKAMFGTHAFSIFMTSTSFSETADFKQNLGAAGLQLNWSTSERQRWIFSIDQYVFQNELGSISSEVSGSDLLAQLLEEEIPISADTAEEFSLVNGYMTDRHMTTLTGVTYKIENIFQISGTLGSNSFQFNRSKQDTKLRTVLGGLSTKLDLSYEEIGAEYKSVGNPFRYQDRRIYRSSPYLDLGKSWKILGDVRREDSAVSGHAQVIPNRNTYITVTNLFYFPDQSFRLSATEFNSRISGRRWIGSFDSSIYFGRDSVDLGTSLSSQWDTLSRLFKRSYSGHITQHILRPEFKTSIGTELTEHYYNSYGRIQFESLSKLSLSFQKIEALIQYDFKPKDIFKDDLLYTGHFRVGHELGKDRIINLFYSRTSLNPRLDPSEVWRFGMEYGTHFN